MNGSDYSSLGFIFTFASDVEDLSQEHVKKMRIQVGCGPLA